MPRDDEFESGWLTRLVRAPGRWWRSWSDLFGDDAIHQEVPFGQRIVRTLTFPFRFLFNFALFLVFEWSTTRNTRAFLWGLPAILTFAGFLAVIWLSFFIGKDRVRIKQAQARYANYLMVDPEHPEVAEMYAERWVSLAPEDIEAKFRLALVRIQAGDRDGGMQILTWLAPLDETTLDGHFDAQQDLASATENQEVSEADSVSEENSVDGPPIESPSDEDQEPVASSRDSDPPVSDSDRSLSMVHTALAQLYLEDGKDPLSEEQRLERAAAHFRAALRLFPASPQALFGKIQLADKAGSDEVAEEAIAQILAARAFSNQSIPVVLPRILSKRVEKGERKQAERIWKNFRTILEDSLKVDPNQSVPWVTLVRSDVALEDYENALSTIRRDATRVTDRDIRVMLARLYADVRLKQAGSFDPLADRQPFVTRLGRLVDASAQGVPFRPVYDELLVYATSITGEQVDWLREFLIDTQRPERVHILLGARDIGDNDFPGGIEHWRIAERLNAMAAKQMLVRLIDAAINRPVLSEVPGAVDDWLVGAIDQFPESVEFHTLQGLLANRRERWESAIQSFREAIRIDANSFTTRQALIETLEASGNVEEAERERAAMETMIEGLSDELRRQAEQYLDSRSQPDPNAD